MKKIYINILFSLTTISLSTSATVSEVLVFNGSGTELRDFDGMPLYPGKSLTAGDIYQIGYYAQATTTEPFSGSWITLKTSTIGYKGSNLGPGQFFLRGQINADGIIEGTPLSIRFYDAVALEEATYFNTVSDATGAWNWITGVGLGSDPPLTLSLADSTLVWQDGPGSAFRTTIAVPETSSSLLTAAALTTILSRRRVRRPV